MKFHYGSIVRSLNHKPNWIGLFFLSHILKIMSFVKFTIIIILASTSKGQNMPTLVTVTINMSKLKVVTS